MELDGGRVVRLVEKPEKSAERPRPRRRVHVRPGGVRGRGGDPARRGVTSSRSPTRSKPDRRREAGRSRGGCAGGGTPGHLEDMLEAKTGLCSRTSSSGSTASSSTPGGGRVVVDGAPAWVARAGSGRDRSGQPDFRLLRRAQYVDRSERGRQALPRSNTRSCSRDRASATSARAWKPACWAATRCLRAVTGSQDPEDDRRRQPRSRSREVLVTGAGGMLGRDVVEEPRRRAAAYSRRSRRARHLRWPRPSTSHGRAPARRDRQRRALRG